MKIFKKMKEWEKDLPEEFVGKRQIWCNAERAKKINGYVEEIRKAYAGASSITRNVDSPYYPDSSTYLTLPNYTHMKSKELNDKMGDLFQTSDYVTVNSKPDGSVQFTFIVLNVWEA